MIDQTLMIKSTGKQSCTTEHCGKIKISQTQDNAIVIMQLQIRFLMFMWLMTHRDDLIPFHSWSI